LPFTPITIRMIIELVHSWNFWFKRKKGYQNH
jgi:hypothetical protein